jgi:1,4-alpha-glucan branching enzyme
MRTSKPERESSIPGTATIASRISEAKPATAGAGQKYGPRQVGNTVMFTAFYPQAKSVQIAGDFNNWQPQKSPMTKASDGTWQASMSLTKGVYRYRLVVDGRWQHDPHNDMTEPNPYGELNSILKVS